MDMNIIKEYLIGLGFKVNSDSLTQAKQSISGVESTIKNFANNNKDNMSSMQGFFKLFSNSLRDNLGIVSKIIPEAKLPLLKIISLVELLYKGTNKISQGFKNINSDKLKESKTETEKASDAMQDFSKKTEETKAPIIQLLELVKELNKYINDLSSNVGNIKFNVEPENLKEVSNAVEDLNNKGNDSINSLESLNRSSKKLDSKQIKSSSDNMEELSKKTIKAKKPILQLIGLVKELNSSIDKLAINLNKINTDKISKKINSSNVKKNSESKVIDNHNPNKLQIPKNTSEAISNTSSKMKKLGKESGSATAALEKFQNVGGRAIGKFAEGTSVSLVMAAASLASFVAVGIGAWKTLTSLANQDLGYQKLAMQLWTTKENAREVDMALKTMKVSMQDLWLSPELLKQFNQLRQDSSQLKLPSDYEDNLKIVRSIVFEFQRLKQAGSLAFQWIGYYILKYAAGPLASIHQALNKFTNGLLKNIPSIAKVIGTVLGVILRIILILIETVGVLVKPIVNIIKFVLGGLSKIPGSMQDIIKLIGLIGAAIMMGPLGAILLLILALDDFFTYLKGGKSVIGSVFNWFSQKAKGATSTLRKHFQGMKDDFHKTMGSLKDDWNYYWDKAKEVLQKVEDKAKKVGEKIKETLKSWKTKISDSFGNFGIKNTSEAQSAIKDFSSKVSAFSANHNFQLPSYLVPSSNNTKNSTTNNNSTNSTTNNFNIYGTNPTGTANAVNNKINNGIKTRNLGGVIG